MRRRRGFWVLLSLVALLCFLGYLQYRWIDRLADAERERQRETLRVALGRLAGAFDVEVTRAQMVFGVGPRFARPGGPPPGERRGPPPRERGGPAPPFFRRWAEDSDEESLRWAEKAQAWAEFAPYPRLVKEVLLVDGDEIKRVTASGVVKLSAMPPQSDLDPTIMLPAGGPQGGTRSRHIVLDGQYIRDELLPRLVPRHLNLERFGITIHSGEATVFARNDFVRQENVRMFSFRPECFAGRSLRGEFRGRGPLGSETAAFIARSNVTCEEAPNTMDVGRWTVEAGLSRSVASGVGEFRTRSLLLSFGVLAVLATGIGVLALYASRAQMLAQRQMEFAMAVSHELRTPLTIIRVAADSLAEGMAGDTQKYGDMIRRETIRLSDMVEKALVFARTQQADLQPQFNAINPGEVIDKALAAVMPTLDSAGLKVDRDVPESVPHMRGDAGLLSTGLQNLLVNAAKYAASGGVIRVKAERVAPAHVSIIVQDNGPGVRNSDLPRIFSAFYRAGEASNSRVPGLGLGLHLVKRIVEAHGGTVRASNRDGASGLEVEMRIPAVES